MKNLAISFTLLFFICIASTPSSAQFQSVIGSSSTSALQSAVPNPNSPIPNPAPHAQGDVSAPNTIYFELLGSGIIYSFNYERLLTNHIGLRGGIGYLGLTSDASTNADGTANSASASIMTIPIYGQLFPIQRCRRCSEQQV